jgi:rod shape-determining protein MreC
MKTLINRKSIIIFSVAVLIAISTIVSVNVLGNSGPVTGLANVISRPLRSLASSVATMFESIYSSIYRYDDLMKDYERLAEENAKYIRDYREVIDIREENDKLHDLLNIRRRYSSYDLIDSMAGNRSASNWSSSFTIKLGYANSDIQEGNAVITEYGMLIGQVSSVDATTSTVITILDTTFSAGAYIGVGDETATVKGDFTLMREGLLMLDHLKEDLTVLPGDTVVTSGQSGMLPPGLVIGEVVEVLRHSTGVGRYATVKPLRDVTTIPRVYIITGFESETQD